MSVAIQCPECRGNGFNLDPMKMCEFCCGSGLVQESIEAVPPFDGEVEAEADETLDASTEGIKADYQRDMGEHFAWIEAGMPTAREMRLEAVLDGALACLRLAHDRTYESRDSELFDTLRHTINVSCREIVVAMRDTDRSGEADETAKQAQPKARAGAEGIAHPDPPNG